MSSFAKSNINIREFRTAAEMETFLSGQYYQKRCEQVWVDWTALAVCFRTYKFEDAGADPELWAKYGVEL
ncbi:MAG: hypothetical protein ABI361_00350 [Nitrososphaera sp.]|jgi:hypothetical protein